MLGVDDLVQRLTELDDVQDVRHQPSAYRIKQEVAVLMPEANQASMPRDLPTAPPRPGTCPRPLHAQHVVIQNLVINLYAAQGPVPFVQQATARTDAGEGDTEEPGLDRPGVPTAQKPQEGLYGRTGPYP